MSFPRGARLTAAASPPGRLRCGDGHARARAGAQDVPGMVRHRRAGSAGSRHAVRDTYLVFSPFGRRYLSGGLSVGSGQ